jgi:asparagine synthase (glutamine-hydrolysing)
MCGIVAVWNRDGRPVDRPALARAVSSLAHRGPDDEGYVLIDTRSGIARPCRGRDTVATDPLPALDDVPGEFDLALGHRRLSVVDTSPLGHQPMTTADGRLWITFNGMIFNFQALRAELDRLGYRCRSRSDTEVVLQAYACWGADCVTRFNGMWAFVIWDGRARTLVASRDRIGVKPLVYRVDATRALFASDTRALFPFNALDDGVEPRAAHHFLSLMQVPAPYTIYRNTFKLRPARTLTVASGHVEERQYWRVPSAPQLECRAEEAAEQLEALIADAVRVRLLGDVPVGSFLSGGLDSSLVAAMARRHSGLPLTTFNVSTPSAPDADESAWALEMARVIQSEHVRIDATAADLARYMAMSAEHDEPFAVSSVLGVFLVARAARTHGTTALLSGDGADELFAGYLHRHVDIDVQWDRFAPPSSEQGRRERALAMGQWVRWHSRSATEVEAALAATVPMSDADGRDTQVMQRRCMLNDLEKRALYTPAWRAALPDEDTIPWLRSRMPAAAADRVLRRQLHDIDTMLHDEMTAKLDRGTMACGIEARTPLLDYRVVEMATSLPLQFRYADGTGKWLLRQVARRDVPPSVLSRPKHGFTIPLERWLRVDLSEQLLDTLSPDALRRTGVFEPSEVQALLQYFDREPNYRTSHMVFTVLTFQQWCERHHPAGV